MAEAWWDEDNMAQLIGEGIDTLTFQMDDGKVLTVAKEGLTNPDSFGTPAPSPQMPQPQQASPAQPVMPAQEPEAPTTSYGVTGSWEEAPAKKPGVLESTESAFNKIADAQKVLNANAEAEAKAQAQGQIAYANQLAAAEQQRQAAEAERQRQAQAQLGELTKANEDYKSFKINTNEWWDNSSTGAKIGAALAIGFGALGAGLQHSHQNQALQIINNAIDRDIQGQKLELEKRGKSVDLESNLYAKMLQKFGDERAAESATRSILKDVALAQTQAEVSKLKPGDARAQGEQMIQKLSIESKKQVMDFMKQGIELRNLENPAVDEKTLEARAQGQELSKAVSGLTSGMEGAGFGGRMQLNPAKMNEWRTSKDQVLNILTNYSTDPKVRSLYESQYIPSPLDSEEVRKSKFEALQTQVNTKLSARARGVRPNAPNVKIDPISGAPVVVE